VHLRMAENATISGGAATARTKESEESTVRDEARNAGEKAAASPHPARWDPGDPEQERSRTRSHEAPAWAWV